MKITKRDIAFFALGIFTIFIIESIIDWNGTKKSFKDGFNSASGIESVE
jgi:hypothetical protein